MVQPAPWHCFGCWVADRNRVRQSWSGDDRSVVYVVVVVWLVCGRGWSITSDQVLPNPDMWHDPRIVAYM